MDLLHAVTPTQAVERIYMCIVLCPEAPTPDPKNPGSNVTLSPVQKEELARIKRKQMANAVHYIWETGEDKYMLRYFHTGFWLSCEQHNEGVWTLRSPPPESFVTSLVRPETFFSTKRVEVKVALCKLRVHTVRTDSVPPACVQPRR